MSITDNLTQSYNRHYLEKSLARELQRSQRMNYPLCVLFADLDYFKAVNDNYGHEAGDELLRSFVDLVKLSIRTEVDWVARYGGEEFIIVLPNSTIDNGVQVAERIRKKLVETKLTIDNTEIQTTCSFGVASNEHFSSLCDFSVLINLADRALYEAKDSGRNCVKIAEPARDNKKAT